MGPSCKASLPRRDQVIRATLFASPALGERHHGRLARLCVAVRWRAVFVAFGRHKGELALLAMASSRFGNRSIRFCTIFR